MNMIKVESSNVAAVGYEDGDLHVQFKGGSNVYVYAEVPSELHAEMMKAESVGRFLNQRIKGHYLATVKEDCPCCDGEGSRLATVEGYEGMVKEDCPECGEG